MQKSLAVVLFLVLVSPLAQGQSHDIPLPYGKIDTALTWAAKEVFVGRLMNVPTAGDSLVFPYAFPDTNFVCLYDVHAVDGTVILGTVRVRKVNKVIFYPPESGVTIQVIASRLK